MNARDNPFRVDRIETIRHRLLGASWDSLMADLARMDYRAAIVGPEGAGKSRLVDALAPRLERLGLRPRRLLLTANRPRFSSGFLPAFLANLRGDEIVLFDGAEQLAPGAWRDFERRSRRAAGLVVTSHREGLLPTLLRCRTTPALFDEIVAELLPVRPPLPEDVDLAALLEKHDGNMREALRELYDVFSRL